MSRPINLTIPSFVVLGMVDLLGEATPYDMKQLAALSLDHFRSVRHAQLYSEPERLTEAGLLEMHRESGGRRRKLYSITPAGKLAFDRWVDVPADTISELRDEGLLKIFFGADPRRVASERIELHRGRLAQFEHTLARHGATMTTGQRLAIRTGIRYERNWIDNLRAIESGELNGEP